VQKVHIVCRANEYDSFWGDVWEIQVPAIQILPVTPINEYMYDQEWARNMFNRAGDAIANPTSGDEWKSVVYLAYSAVDPADAASRSASLTTWGSGNSYSNQLYFISTRPGASGVCSSAPANPLGSFALQATSNNQFISSSGLPNLMATGASQSDAAVFDFGFAPNAGTIKAASNNQFVTADSSGNFTISASRAVASDWEIFVIRPKEGEANGVYTIQAGSNKKYVVVGADGSLINTADSANDGAGFRFVSA
jgi:endo-1,3(4)-beta-glucanase